MNMREHVKIKRGLLGSSSLKTLSVKKSCLERAHEKNVDFFSSLKNAPLREPSDDTLVRPWNPFKGGFDSKRIPYAVVKSAGCKWAY